MKENEKAGWCGCPNCGEPLKAAMMIPDDHAVTVSMTFESGGSMLNAESAAAVLRNSARLLRHFAKKDGGRWVSVLLSCNMRDDGIDFRIGILRQKNESEAMR